MKSRHISRAALLAIAMASAAPAFALTPEFVNFDNQAATLTSPPNSDPAQTIVIPGIATFTGGACGSATQDLDAAYVTYPNAYATAYIPGSGTPNATNPLLDTLTMTMAASYPVQTVNFPIFNGIPSQALSFQVNAYSGSTVVSSDLVSSVPPFQSKLGAADPDVGLASLSSASPDITSVTITPTTFPSGGWDFIIDSISFNQPIVSSLVWDNAGGASPSDGATWDVSENNNWNNGTAATVFAQNSAVTFDDSNNGHYAVTLNTSVAPASTTFDNSSGNYTLSGSGGISGNGAFTKTGTGTLTMSTANSYTGGTTVSSGVLKILPTSSSTSALPRGSLTIMGGGTLALGSNVTLGSQSGSTPASNVNLTSLVITGNGAMDLANNDIIVDYTAGNDPIASIAAWITSGYAAGAWNGPGIFSSTAQANSTSYGIGYADAADPGNPAGLPSGEIEIKYTLLGDANLDGKVNGTDFAILATNFNEAVTAWDQGDFNYDRKVNGTDFAFLASNFNQGASQSADRSALEAFAAANGLTADLPEPGATAMLLLGTLGFIKRHSR